jgi:hypothetical protein
MCSSSDAAGCSRGIVNEPHPSLALVFVELFQFACSRCIARMLSAQLLGRSPPSISLSTQRVLLLLPCTPCVPSLREAIPATVWLHSPLEWGPHPFLSTCIDCIADMSDIALPTEPVEFILKLLLRRAPNPPPSDPVSQHRTEIVSSSLDQGSTAERISSSLALCHHFGFGFGPVIRPCLRTGPFFLRHPDATKRGCARYLAARSARRSVKCPYLSVS